MAQKEADVKPQKGGEPRLERKPRIRAARTEDLAVTAASPLSAEEAAVIECLRTAAMEYGRQTTTIPRHVRP